MKIKGLSQPHSRHQRDPDSLLPDLCRGEGLFGVVVMAELLSLLLVIFDKGLMPIDWQLLGRVSFLALWIALLSAAVLCLARERVADLALMKGAALCYSLILIITALCSGMGQWLLLYLNAAGGRQGYNIWQVFEHVIIAAIPAGILLRYLFLQQQLQVQQRAELESRIQALQSRIRPHFLFNSMNMIASLIGSDPEKAERVVEDLSDLFRHALTDTRTLIPLREELNLSRRYLKLEKLRLGDRLRTVWEIGDYGVGVQIPCLTIQPVLENAVYHGIQLIPEGGEIKITVNRVKNRIVVSVSNPRNPRMQHNKGNKMAMNNVQTRLEAHFGQGTSVRAELTENSFITHISYPLPL